jgi:hypothetical protein
MKKRLLALLLVFTVAVSIVPITSAGAVVSFNMEVVIINGEHLIELHNTTNKTISTKGLYLSVNSLCEFNDCENCTDEKSCNWQMPVVIIGEGQSVQVKTDSDDVTPILKRMRTNFDLSSGDTLRLYDVCGNVLGEFKIEPPIDDACILCKGKTSVCIGCNVCEDCDTFCELCKKSNNLVTDVNSALAWLVRNLGINPEHLVHYNTLGTNMTVTRTYCFYQYYNGVRVYDGTIWLVVMRTTEVVASYDSKFLDFVINSGIDVTPNVSAEEIIEMYDNLDFYGSVPELIIYPYVITESGPIQYAEKPVLAYYCRTAFEDLIVCAISGEVLRRWQNYTWHP